MSGPLTDLWRLLLGAAALVGGSVGSFINVVAWRLPLGRSLVHPPSACPACRSPIRPWHNVPVFGWLALRGRCADCGEPIAARYPLVEAATGVLWVGLFVTLLPQPDLLLEPRRIAVFAAYGVYVSALLAAVLIDLDHFILPDSITLPLIPLGLLSAAVFDAWGLGPTPFPEAVFGAVAGAGAMVGVTLLGRALYGREAMGLGDAKLVAAIGAWQGLHPTLLVVVVVASMLGSIVGLSLMAIGKQERGGRMPFGPFLAAGALLDLAAGDRLWSLLVPG